MKDWWVKCANRDKQLLESWEWLRLGRTFLALWIQSLWLVFLGRQNGIRGGKRRRTIHRRMLLGVRRMGKMVDEGVEEPQGPPPSPWAGCVPQRRRWMNVWGSVVGRLGALSPASFLCPSTSSSIPSPAAKRVADVEEKRGKDSFSLRKRTLCARRDPQRAWAVGRLIVDLWETLVRSEPNFDLKLTKIFKENLMNRK